MRWRGFVIVAGMRTGSNRLEAAIRAMPGADCHGEAFNPAFLGAPGQEALLGVTRAERQDDAARLLRAIWAAPGLNGFRLFDGHDRRALDAVLADAAVAKIVLTRDPLHAWVSLAIARATGQWRLTEARHRRSARIRFDPAAFEAHRAADAAFRHGVRHRLMADGQVPFTLDFDDLGDRAVIAGLARWLGVGPPADLPEATLRQNPRDLRAKVENYDEMVALLGQPVEPELPGRRAAHVPAWQVADGAGLVHMPLGAGPDARVAAWLRAVGGAPPRTGLTQKDLRRWLRARPVRRAFAVLRHPVPRAWAAFTEVMSSEADAELRAALARDHGVDPRDAVATAFRAFLGFVRLDLGGQTGRRPDPRWALQSAALDGIASVLPPDELVREADLGAALPRLAAAVGAPELPVPPATGPTGLPEVYDDQIERTARDIWARDYLRLGIGPWRG